MKFRIISILLISLLCFNLAVTVQSSPLVNIQVDGESLEGGDKLSKIMDELEKRGFKATVYVTTLFVNEQRPVIDKILSKPGYEIAIHGYKTGEILESLNYEDQKSRIKSTISALVGCIFCNNFYLNILGFRPQYFSQNKETFSILDELGILYNSGFIEGMIYLPGHENDPAPYKVEGHNFYAVPISSFYSPELNERIYLCDMSVKNKYKLTPDKWLEILKARLEISINKDIPLVVIFHDVITGSDDRWLNVFSQFLDEVRLKGLKTVTTAELVNEYRRAEK